jgi:hypothetical protein
LLLLERHRRELGEEVILWIESFNIKYQIYMRCNNLT